MNVRVLSFKKTFSTTDTGVYPRKMHFGEIEIEYTEWKFWPFWYKKHRRTEEVYSEGVYWRFVETGELCPLYQVENLIRAEKAKSELKKLKGG